MFDPVANEHLIARLAAQTTKAPREWEADARNADGAWHRGLYSAVAARARANATLPAAPAVDLPKKPWKR